MRRMKRASRRYQSYGPVRRAETRAVEAERDYRRAPLRSAGTALERRNAARAGVTGALQQKRYEEKDAMRRANRSTRRDRR